MTRADRLRKLQEMTKNYRPATDEQADALVEALLCIAATAYASFYKVGSNSIQELANAAYEAIQDKADEIGTRN